MANFILIWCFSKLEKADKRISKLNTKGNKKASMTALKTKPIKNEVGKKLYERRKESGQILISLFIDSGKKSDIRFSKRDKLQ